MGKMNFVTLEAAMVRDWLNQQIKIRNMQKASYKFNAAVMVHDPENDIAMTDGVFYIADLLELELEEQYRENHLYPWKYSFEYEGTRFYQLFRERPEKYAGEADV